MKQYLLPALLFVVTFLSAQNDTISSIVKINIPDIEKNGSGLIIGHDSQKIYILTAAHVLANPDDDKEPLNETLKINALLFLNSANNDKKLGRFECSTELFDAKLDLGVISIFKGTLFKDHPYLTAVLERTNHAFTQFSSNSIGSQITLKAFPGGSERSFSSTPLYITASHDYDDNSAFATDATRVTGGHSGGAIFNGNNEFMGMIIHIKGDQKSCKALKLNTILYRLQNSTIPTNLLKTGILVERWLPVGLAYPGEALKAFPPTSPLLQISSDGRLSGLCSGNISIEKNDCFKRPIIKISGIPNGGVVLEPIHDGVSAYNLPLTVLDNSKEYQLKLTYAPSFSQNQTKQLLYLKLVTDTHEVWLTPAYAVGR